MTFTLTIELGNAAMQTGVDIANALRSTADRVQYVCGDEPPNPVSTGGIRALNGNTVGEWEVK